MKPDLKHSRKSYGMLLELAWCALVLMSRPKPWHLSQIVKCIETKQCWFTWDVGLAELHVGPGSVDEDLHPVQSHVDVTRPWVPQLLANLEAEAGVNGGDDSVTYRTHRLALNPLDYSVAPRQVWSLTDYSFNFLKTKMKYLKLNCVLAVEKAIEGLRSAGQKWLHDIRLFWTFRKKLKPKKPQNSSEIPKKLKNRQLQLSWVGAKLKEN